MENLELVLKQEVNEQERLIIKEFKDNFGKLIEYTHGNLNCYVHEDAIEIEDDTTKNLVWDLLRNIRIVSFCVDMQEFMGQFSSKEYYSSINVFLRWLDEYVTERSHSWQETGFIRESDIDRLKLVLKYCFENYVMVNERVEGAYGDIDEKQIRVICKVFYTLMDMTIVRNYGYKRTKSCAYEMFVWSDEVFECFWLLIDANREALWKIELMTRLDNINNVLQSVDI